MDLAAVNIPKSIPKDRFLHALSYLPKERQDYIHSFHQIPDAYRSLLGDWLARAMLSPFMALPSEQIAWNVDASGKPILSVDNLHFNITHSNDWVICVVGRDLVGVDLEFHHPMLLQGLESTCFSPQELRFLENLQGKLRTKAMYDVWTLKESWLKCIGAGLEIAPKLFTILLNQDPPTIQLSDYGKKLLKEAGYFKGHSGTYTFQNYSFAPEYSLSICSFTFGGIHEESVRMDSFPPQVRLIDWDTILPRS